jgi:2-polyprenyl-6-hydroxyphenyl methylase/3-demethylubiquinone-9 3-methyltransferase
MTIIVSEIDRFNRLSATWWNSAGPMRPLHVINALRLEYLRQLMTQQFNCAVPSNLEGLRILDIGCGAGLLCEPLARSGAQVTGIDAAARNVAAARIHAASRGITIDYRVGDPAMALRPDERFDVVLLLEVVEHVADVESFVAAAGRHVAPGGMLVASTIDRTWKSFAVAIVGAEYVFRVLPKGTHDWHRFVRPAELESAASLAGLALADLRGMRYLPLMHRASWVRDTSVNYVAAFSRADATPRRFALPQR